MEIETLIPIKEGGRENGGKQGYMRREKSKPQGLGSRNWGSRVGLVVV